MAKNHGVAVEEAYKDFVCPVNAPKAVERLLSGIPKQYLSGLGSVVLTNTGGLSRGRRRQKTRSRKRRVAIPDARGLYHQEWRGTPAWIEIFVDNVLGEWPAWELRIPFFRDMAIAEVLFHELGHHIHRTQAPEYKEREDVAEKWERRLVRTYFWPKYWYIVLPLRLVGLVLKPFQHSRRKS